MKRNLLLFILGALLLVLVSCNKDNTENNTNSPETNKENVLTVGTPATRSPFIFKEGEKVTGYDAEVIEEAAKRAGYVVKWEIAEFEGLFGMLDSGKIDVIACQLNITAERKERYNFTTPYLYSGLIFAVREDDPTIKTIEDLEGKTIGVGLGTAAEKSLSELNKDNIFKVKPLSLDPVAELKEVEFKRADAFYNDQVQVKIALEKGNIKNVKILTEPQKWGSIGFPFTKDNIKFEKINKALEEMKTDGSLKKLSEKWLGFDATQEKI